MKQMTLGELISALERKDEAKHVYFDFVYFAPDGVSSYRGDYSQLAITYSDGGAMLVGDFLSILREANGKEFTGYKGGQYLMHSNTPLWVANNGEAGRTAVVDVNDLDGAVVISTAKLGL